MNLAAYGAVISTIALMLSLLGLWLHWLRWRVDVRNKRPLVTIKRSVRYPRLGRWTPYEIMVRSRDNQGWHAKCLRVAWPPSAKVMPAGAAKNTSYSVNASPHYVLEHENGKRRMDLNLRVAEAGRDAPYMGLIRLGDGDTHSVTLFVSASPSIWSRVLSILRRRSSTSSRDIFIRLAMESDDRWSDHISRAVITSVPTDTTITPSENR